MTNKPANHRRPFDLVDLAIHAGREGMCVLHTGLGEGKTLIGLEPKRTLKNWQQLNKSLRSPGKMAMGFFAYPNPTLKNAVPDMRFYEYDFLQSFRSSKVTCATKHSVAHPSRQSTSAPKASVTKAQYLKKIHQIKELLAAGEVYQVNYAVRFRKRFTGDPYELFLKLNQASPAGFSAYLNCGDFQIVSASPERFFKVDRGKIITQPIKGTMSKTGGAPALARLLASPKERAELDMITDLERNDVGKICEYGTLKLNKRREVLELGNLWHCYSEVEGKLVRGTSPQQIMTAMFPGGSITGCPKKRAMETIEGIENMPRNIYTGSIGYITTEKTITSDDKRSTKRASSNDQRFKLDFNIAIRTALIKDGWLEYWAGGGIVADSDPEKEYAECLLKAERFLGII